MRIATCKWQRERWRWWYESEIKNFEILKVGGGQCNVYTMVKQQYGYFNVCVNYPVLCIHGHPWTTIISTERGHLIYLAPIV